MLINAIRRFGGPPADARRQDDAKPTLGSTQPTGPIGRIARLGLAILFALSLLSIVGPEGSARFRNPHVLGEASAWFLHLMMVVVFVFLVGALASALAGPHARWRWQLIAVVALVAAVVVGAGVTKILHGSPWGFPLADLVWWFDVLVLIEQAVALLLAVALGTRGCEIGVWAQLLARVRGGSAHTEDTLACLVGLHLLDKWEAGRH